MPYYLSPYPLPPTPKKRVVTFTPHRSVSDVREALDGVVLKR